MIQKALGFVKTSGRKHLIFFFDTIHVCITGHRWPRELEYSCKQSFTDMSGNILWRKIYYLLDPEPRRYNGHWRSWSSKYFIFGTTGVIRTFVYSCCENPAMYIRGRNSEIKRWVRFLHVTMSHIEQKCCWRCTDRKDEKITIIDSLRIDHTRLTHSFKVENKPLDSICNQCKGNHELIIKHILIACDFVNTIRR